MEHLINNNSAALFYDPGLGKTSTTLQAFKTLQEAGVAQRALVIAPVRVCQLVWEQEAAGWTQFKDLRFANMASKSAQTRKNQLLANADIWLINPESVPWLVSQFQFQRLPFDTVIIDELTKFKNSRAKRSKQLQPLIDGVQRKWGLTGTPAPNGYEDLFGQMKILDGGAALGVYITQYRDRYFTRGRDGFSYELRPGADKLIQDKLKPYVHALRAEDYLDLPPLVEHEIAVELPKAVMEQYKHLKKQMVLDLPNASITAVNAAALSNKLTQFTGGAVYTADGAYSIVHDAKIEALEELVEELSGQQLLVAYHYNHELERLLSKFPHAKYIGSGVTGKQALEIEEEWNSGRLKLLFGHPASMGHGLNMQKSGASHICWFTQTWDYELYDQFIKRVLRGGTTATRITNHRLIAVETIDKAIGDAVVLKRNEQDSLLDALKAEFIKDDPASGRVFAQGDSEVRKIAGPDQTAPQQEIRQTTVVAPTGWNKVAAPTAQAQVQADKVAGPQTQPLAQAAQQGNWAAKFVQTVEAPAAQPAPPTEAPKRAWGAVSQAEPPTTPYPEQNVDPQLVEAGSFAQLAAIQQQVLQPGDMDPRFTTGQNISTGEERVDTQQLANAAQSGVPFDDGQPAAVVAEQGSARTGKPAARSRKKAETSAPAASITFDVGNYIVGRMGQGESFVVAQNEAAQIVEAMEG